MFSFSTAQAEKISRKIFVKQICENIWWIRYLAGGFLVAVKFLKKKLQWWFF